MFTREEAAEILEKEGSDPFPSKTAKLFFSFSYYTGFSVDILLSLKWDAVNWKESFITDGEKKRPITEKLRPFLEELKASSMDTSPDHFIFTDDRGKALSEEFVEKEFEKTMEAAGIDFRKRKLSPNSFRRTYNFWYA